MKKRKQKAADTNTQTDGHWTESKTENNRFPNSAVEINIQRYLIMAGKFLHLQQYLYQNCM